MAGTKTDPMR